MSLFVRVHVGYWTHRKTVRLAALLGPESVCIPIKLWCYAAQNQPDGDFTKYLPAEIAMLVGYLGDAEHMLQALQQAGFLDSLCIHGWEEHNSYHQTYADRAKKAAAARWEKQREEDEKRRKRKERKGKEASNASSMTEDEKKEKAKEVWSSLPTNLDVPEFRKTWGEYIAYRRLKKIDPLLPESVVKQWEKLSEYGPEVSIRAINHTIANSYQGIFPEKHMGKNGHPGNGKPPLRKLTPQEQEFIQNNLEHLDRTNGAH